MLQGPRQNRKKVGDGGGGGVQKNVHMTSRGQNRYVTLPLFLLRLVYSCARANLQLLVSHPLTSLIFQ